MWKIIENVKNHFGFFFQNKEKMNKTRTQKEHKPGWHWSKATRKQIGKQTKGYLEMI